MVEAAVRQVMVFGATGSVGTSALDLIGRFPERFRASVLTANNNAASLADLALRHRPDHVVLADEQGRSVLEDRLKGSGINCHYGSAALVQMATHPADMIVAAITGMAGLPSTLAALETGHTVAIANKETLVAAGPVMMSTARRSGAVLIPVDSEHNAIFQTMLPGQKKHIEEITLTASGGPFIDSTSAELAAVTPAQAICHPTWSMGAKISVDSATMMNKGLEVIEAAVLFGLSEEQIKVVIHRQSVIHGMVRYSDGSVLAQLGPPDMRVPLAHALAWPERLAWSAPPLDLAQLARLDFADPDYDRFPALVQARTALRAGGVVPAILNAANEVAVAAFLEGRISFLEITSLTGHMLDNALARSDSVEMTDLDAVFEADTLSRNLSKAWIAQR